MRGHLGAGRQEASPSAHQHTIRYRALWTKTLFYHFSSRGKDINSFEKQEKVDGLNFLYNPNNDRMRNGHIIIDGTGLFKQIMKSGT